MVIYNKTTKLCIAWLEVQVGSPFEGLPYGNWQNIHNSARKIKSFSPALNRYGPTYARAWTLRVCCSLPAQMGVVCEK